MVAEHAFPAAVRLALDFGLALVAAIRFRLRLRIRLRMGLCGPLGLPSSLFAALAAGLQVRYLVDEFTVAVQQKILQPGAGIDLDDDDDARNDRRRHQILIVGSHGGNRRYDQNGRQQSPTDD
ncbi:MAG: hypothetical protein KH318_06770 [Oscillibacter sp.]|nr:hypothetical protein [Oscillibacter sp.]